MKIYTIETNMGKTTQSIPFLTEEQCKEFNSIGYSGKTTNGVPSNYSNYLNSLGIGHFKVQMSRCDSSTFYEEYTIVHDENPNVATNELLQKFGKTLLERAYEKHELIDVGNYEEDGWCSCFVLDKQSIINVFDEVFEQFKM